MENKQLDGEKLKKILLATIVFVIGVLLCCSLSFGVRGLSWLIGVSISIAGVIYITNTVKCSKSIANMQGFLGSILIAFGAIFIANRMAGIVVDFIPWCMVSIGSVLVIDSFLAKFIKKNASIARFVCELILGVLTVVLGICLKLISSFGAYAAAALGGFMIVYAVLTVFSIFTGKN